MYKKLLVAFFFLILLGGASAFCLFGIGDCGSKPIFIIDKNVTDQNITQVFGGDLNWAQLNTVVPWQDENVADDITAINYVRSDIWNLQWPLVDANILSNIRYRQDASCDNNSDCTITGDITGAIGLPIDTNTVTAGWTDNTGVFQIDVNSLGVLKSDQNLLCDESTCYDISDLNRFSEITVSGGTLELFFFKEDSGVVDYNVMDTNTALGSQETFTRTLTVAKTEIVSFFYNNNDLNVIENGVSECHFHGAKTGGTKDITISCELYERDSGGNESLLWVSEQSDELTGSSSSFDVHASHDTLFFDGNFLVVKVFASVSGVGSNPTIDLEIEGNTASHLGVPVAVIVEHNLLQGLQGGSTDERYHFEQSEHSVLTSFVSDGLDLNQLQDVDTTGFKNKWRIAWSTANAQWEPSAPEAETIVILAEAGEAIGDGNVVHVSGQTNGTPIVSLADASDPSKMPAIGIATESAGMGDDVMVATYGHLNTTDTNAFSIGDDLYVSTTLGGFTNVKPTGTALIQKIAEVLSVGASGHIFIFGAGRTNDIPNIAKGSFWLGDSSGVPQATDFNTVYDNLFTLRGAFDSNAVLDSRYILLSDSNDSGRLLYQVIANPPHIPTSSTIDANIDARVQGVGQDYNILGSWNLEDNLTGFGGPGQKGGWFVGRNADQNSIAIFDIIAFTQMQGITLTTIDANTDIIPFLDSTFDLGAEGMEWAELWVDDIFSNTLQLGATIQVNSILDEDNMASDSATALSTQQSIKKYVDDQAGGIDPNHLHSKLVASDGTPDPALSIDATGNMALLANTDVSAEIGRAHVGYIGLNDYAGFSHVDQNSLTNYALLQSSIGETFLNAATGKKIYFRINNANIGTWNATGLGIGTDSPLDILHIQEGTSAQTDIRFEKFTTTATSAPNIRLLHSNSATKGTLTQSDDDDTLGRLVFEGVDNGGNRDQAIEIIGYVDGAVGARIPGRIEFGTATSTAAPTARMTILSGGNVGIGTNSPDDILVVQEDGIAQMNISFEKFTTTAASRANVVVFHSNSNTKGTLTANDDGDVLGAFRFDGVDSGNNRETGGQIRMVVDGSVGVEIPGRMEFMTATAAAANTVKMVIEPAGNVGVATITPTILVSANEKVGFTSIGGVAIKLTNRSLGNSVEGELVEASGVNENAVALAGTSDAFVIGVFYESGVAVGDEAWIVVSGIAEVRANGDGFAQGDRLGASASDAGRADTMNSPGSPRHFDEIGHAIETAGANALGKAVLHFN